MTTNETREGLKTIFVTGGTGLIGRALLEVLVKDGVQVTCLTRDASRAQDKLPPGALAQPWSGEHEQHLDLNGVDAVVHLAGEQAVGARLTEERKRKVLESRVKTARVVVDAMKRAARPPRVFLSASAVGYYGPHESDELLDEHSPPGGDFLADVCQAWEAEAKTAEEVGARVVCTRFGIVFGKRGPLELMAKPFRMFVGGPIAGGKQVVSWVDQRDVARAIAFCLFDPQIRGPVNVCSPQPATNGEISAEIARVLGRPNYLPVPAFGLKALFGAGAEPIITGQRVRPAVLLERGFSFQHADLSACLRDHLG